MPNFGQYQLLDRIAVGGMAEVFRGRAVGEEGFEKLVAIKRVLPSYAADARFVGMLVTEARIHAALSHRNIVQIHDLGISEDGEYFIVLEYVDGPDLSTMLARLAELAETPPENAEEARAVQVSDAVALYIAIELGEGMHFAHDLTGPEGQPLGLVHRDISPSNVLLSYAGEVKLSDFGLAKRRTDHSVVGSLKGKLAYMSPEQARRSALDRRSDIFSLGAVLFEMLTGQRLRTIIDDISGWQQVASGLVPPARRFRPDLSPALDGLLFGALAPDPRDRFADARAFVAAARVALAELPRSPAGEAGELGALLKQLCPPGSARPVSPQSKVIRLMSEFLGSGGKDGADFGRGTRNAGGRPPASTTAVTTIGPAPRGTSQETVSVDARVIQQLTEEETDREQQRAGVNGRRAGAPAGGALSAGLDGRNSQAAASAPTTNRPSGPVAARSGSGAFTAPAPDPSSWTNLPAMAGALAGRPGAPARTSIAGPPAHGLGAPGTPPRGTTPVGTPPRGTAARLGRKRSTFGPLLLLFALGACAAGLVVHLVFIPLPVLAVWGQPARFEIRSDPIGAEVYLDGERLYALTPTYTEVRRDRRPHTLELHKEGFAAGREVYRYDRSARLEVVMILAPSTRPAVEPLPARPAGRPAR
jgi:serine/threonine protein kinase